MTYRSGPKTEDKWRSWDRREAMLEMRFRGATLRAIGDAFGVTHERVRQALAKQIRESNPGGINSGVWKDCFSFRVAGRKTSDTATY
jgi:hypothetical protein